MERVENKEFVYEFGKFLLDPKEKTLFADGEKTHLPAREFETLLLLVENNGRALSKEEMMSAIWQDAFVEESNLAKQISRLRKIFNTNGEQFIETLPKHGYRFSADLRLIAQTLDKPVILERRTVKRLTVSVEKEAEPSALPSAKRPRYRWFGIVLPVIAIIGLVYLAWHFGRNNVEQIDPYAPIRLTDNPLDDTGPMWTNDGRIRFTRILADKRFETWIMNADGTGQTAIPMPQGKRIFSWSPDEKKVLFQKDGKPEAYLSNADGSGEVLLQFRGGNWSADSKMLVYHQKVTEHNWDIFVYSVETGKSRNITNNEAFDADPSFSPDGKQVVFASIRDGNGEIYSIDIDGGNLRRLTFNPTIDAHPVFSPDGTQISFNSDRENENSDVYFMNADGSNVTKLTNFDKSNETLGLGGWSRDGTKIAFFSDRNGKDDIYVMSAEMVRAKLVLSEPEHDIGSFSYSPDQKKIVYSKELEDKSGELKIFDVEAQQMQLVRKTELPNVSADWSPGGDLIAFHDRIDGNSEVCVVKPDGSDFLNLTNDPASDAGASWSPDGRRIVFVAHRNTPVNIPQLYTMNADGSDPRPITPRKGWEGSPVWLPDGGGTVFVCDRNDSPGNLLDVCQINLDGSDEKRILFHPGHDGQPAVSPDGSRIAFTASSDGNNEIYLVNADGTGLLRLTRNSADDQVPEWSSDGSKLMFISNRGGKFAIYEVDVP
ncbi:MAG: winged helix-turn-helix domain-containing protein [Blastocatellia bacterium]